MRKYTLTTIDRLKPGDTYLKEDDPLEIIYTILDRNCTIKGKRYVQKGELKMTDMVDLKKQIIFLKHQDK